MEEGICTRLDGFPIVKGVCVVEKVWK